MAHLRAQVVWTGTPGSPFLTTINSSETVTSADFKAAVLDLIGPMLAGVSSNLYGEVQDEYLVIDSSTDEIVEAGSWGASGFQGGDTGTPLPYQTQGLARFTTGVFVEGRRISGRMFVPGPTQTSNSDALPLPTYVGRITDAIQDCVADHPGVLGVYSKKNAQSYPIIGGSGWNNWAILRSRRD